MTPDECRRAAAYLRRVVARGDAEADDLLRLIEQLERAGKELR